MAGQMHRAYRGSPEEMLDWRPYSVCRRAQNSVVASSVVNIMQTLRCQEKTCPAKSQNAPDIPKITVIFGLIFTTLFV